MTKNEMLEKLRNCRTLREAGITREDVMSVLDCAEETVDQSETIAEYQKTIDNLRQSVKKLRTENKKLREAAK